MQRRPNKQSFEIMFSRGPDSSGTSNDVQCGIILSG